MEDGETSVFLCTCRGWLESGSRWGLERWLEMGEILKLISNDFIVMGVGEVSVLGRRDRKKWKGKEIWK